MTKREMTKDELNEILSLAYEALCVRMDKEEAILKKNPDDTIAPIRLERYQKQLDEIHQLMRP